MPKHPTASSPRDWVQHDVDHVRALLRHDARAPLHVLALYGQVLADRAETAELGGPIVDAAHEIRAVFDQIERWLSLGPPTSGPADPATTVQQLSSQRTLTLQVAVASPQVAMHPRHLRMVLEALLGPPEGPPIEVWIEDDPEGIALAISIPEDAIAPDADTHALVTRLVDASGGSLAATASQWRMVLPRAG
jgi:hypothetical protein